MSDQNPYEKLGVTNDASFEEIQNAKSRLSQEYREDSKLVESIEAAYDAIIMERLKMRQEGKIKVPERIRFPERSVESSSTFTPISASQSPSWLQELVDTPSRGDILWPAGVFLGLGLLTFLDPSPASSTPSLVIALAFCANVYFLNRKENRFGRSVLMGLIGLLVGVGLGIALNGTLNFSGLADHQVAALVALLIFWVTSSFLR
ncbi:CPP1-like family protein [Lusitaniella coriacea LEGE 07157]|uniref:CPP1-like family protein n=1 Tax=Lusitaniella coriacea LEGE 07157 TaxID=945747 RepID=A0A8J7DXH7_9CYAN|nr:CPP1-like family protein [Lusitaniella coriacea]MBE9117061.1 CPP1-like family protein [Lusitaniella coriacea LEGE 07157]